MASTHDKPRATGRCPSPGATVPPGFCICADAGNRVGDYFVYAIMIDADDNEYCSGPHTCNGNPFSFPFDVALDDGTYNLYLHILDDNTGVKCGNVAGNSNELIFIRKVTIQDGAADPCKDSCPKIHKSMPLVANYQANRFRVTFMGANGTVGNNIGWVELLDGSTPRGYIYFLNIPDTQALPPDHLSADGSYIVMSQRTKYLDAFLTVLKGPKPLAISFSNGLALLSSPDTLSATGNATPDSKGLEVWKELNSGKKQGY